MSTFLRVVPRGITSYLTLCVILHQFTSVPLANTQQTQQTHNINSHRNYPSQTMHLKPPNTSQNTETMNISIAVAVQLGSEVIFFQYMSSSLLLLLLRSDTHTLFLPTIFPLAMSSASYVNPMFMFQMPFSTSIIDSHPPLSIVFFIATLPQESPIKFDLATSGSIMTKIEPSILQF